MCSEITLMKRPNIVARRNSRTVSGATLQAVPIKLGEPQHRWLLSCETHSYTCITNTEESVEIHESYLIREHANIRNYKSMAYHLHLEIRSKAYRVPVKEDMCSRLHDQPRRLNVRNHCVSVNRAVMGRRVTPGFPQWAIMDAVADNGGKKSK